MDSYECELCHKNVHISNRVVHSLRCQRASHTESIERVDESINVAENQIEQSTSVSGMVLHSEGMLFVPVSEVIAETVDVPFCECPRCTYHNEVSADQCGVCGYDFRVSSSENGGNSSFEHRDSPAEQLERCTSPSSSSRIWRCSSCTYVNSLGDSQCVVCLSMRPPLQSVQEQLIHEDEETSGHSDSRHDWMERNMGDDAEIANSLTSSMLLGAGIGAGLAWLNRSDVSTGAMAGAGLGAVGDLALREFAAAERSRQEQRRQSRLADEQSRNFRSTTGVTPRGDQGWSGGGTSTRNTSASTSSRNTDSAAPHRPQSLEAAMMQAFLSEFSTGGTGAVRRRGDRGGTRSVRMGGFELDIDNMPFEALLERFPAPPRGVDPTTLNALPVRSYTQPTAPPAPSVSSDHPREEGGSGRSCSICMEEYATGESVKTLPCLHCFHAPCVDHWLREHNTCPVCKHSLS